MSLINSFEQLGIAKNILTALTELGYEAPTPIQAQSIPFLIQGRDLLAQAQTGTGKTAAFALPILTHIDLSIAQPQALVLAPTRELAIQVAETFQSYAKHLPRFHVLPIYGGQDFRTQLKALKRGVHVVVGTPGRIMDHLRRGTIALEKINTIVLDEADEMLKMGFIEDVEWILQQLPNALQTALFSATMPTSIQNVANRYLNNAETIKLSSKEKTVEAIEQYSVLVSKNHKLEALTRFLEIEDIDGAIIFTRTKNASAELAEKLEARGYAASALNGDMNQQAREKVITRLKHGKLDIVVATDVAARGIDVERISHVINYDIPYDTESYVHRIGRTGRAGRSGKAILFIAPRERRMLRDLTRAIKQTITAIDPPTLAQINVKRAQNFVATVQHTLTTNDLDHYRELVENIVHQSECSELDVAAALAFLSQKEKPLHATTDDPLLASNEHETMPDRQPRKTSEIKAIESGMTRCRIEVGRKDALKPGDVVGAIANEARIKSTHIGSIQIFSTYSLVDIESHIVHAVIERLYSSKVKNRSMMMQVVTEEIEHRRKPKKKAVSKRSPQKKKAERKRKK